MERETSENKSRTTRLAKWGELVTRAQEEMEVTAGVPESFQTFSWPENAVFPNAPAFDTLGRCRLKFQGADSYLWPDLLEASGRTFECMYLGDVNDVGQCTPDQVTPKTLCTVYVGSFRWRTGFCYKKAPPQKKSLVSM